MNSPFTATAEITVDLEVRVEFFYYGTSLGVRARQAEDADEAFKLLDRSRTALYNLGFGDVAPLHCEAQQEAA